MANLMEMIQGMVTDQLMENLTNQIGAKDKSQTQAAAQGALSAILAGLNKNSNDPKGAENLAHALERDHDGSILDNLSNMIGGAAPNTKATNGEGILDHVLGGKKESTADIISKLSGIDKKSAANLMIKMAPVVMGALGKMKKEHNMSAGDISDLLTNTVKSSAQDRAEMNMLEKFLDQDGDGSIMDDLADQGGKFLGSFFK